MQKSIEAIEKEIYENKDFSTEKEKSLAFFIAACNVKFGKPIKKEFTLEMFHFNFQYAAIEVTKEFANNNGLDPKIMGERKFKEEMSRHQAVIVSMIENRFKERMRKLEIVFPSNKK